MKILTKQQINDELLKHYIDRYGERNTDVWYEQPATNVWVFRRNGKIITLICHILTGVVTERIEEGR